MATAYGFFWSFEVWSWLMALLYLGLRWFEFRNKALEYMQESVLPVYVIHHPIVLLIASFVVTGSAGVWPKFAAILVLTFALTLGIYEFGVRRWRVTRIMFGLKALRAGPVSGKPGRALQKAETG
jgi:surface polysaccharide O-acyltransferase-like enzyme